jgi:hypothetical protein
VKSPTTNPNAGPPRWHRIALALLAGVPSLGACGGQDAGARDAGQPDVAVDMGAISVGTPQLPPRGRAALEAWLAEGWYRAWQCEAAISPPRLTGNHGRHRICSNETLLASAAGPYPVGAASVKELFVDAAGTMRNGFAVGLKVDAGEGPSTWYWYERRGAKAAGPVLAEGIGVPDCAVCHGMAARDQVFITAAP